MSENEDIDITDIKGIENCRMYRKELPEENDLVMVEITKVTDTGVFSKLLEYNGIEGMMIISEVSKRKWNTIKKQIRPGRKEIVLVLRVDTNRRYVDLSKKQVPTEERVKFMKYWENSKSVHGIVYSICLKCQYSMLSLYDAVIWKLYDEYPHALEGLKTLITDEVSFLKKYKVPVEIKKELIYTINKRLKKRSTKIRADIEVTCFTELGIESVKEALIEGQSLSTKEIPIEVRYISPPQYVIYSTAYNINKAIDKINQASEVIKESIIKKGGNFNLKLPARVYEES